jgi:hypothetical protein
MLPFPKKPVKLDYIYYHMGRLAFSWAEAEHALDACLFLFEVAHPDPLYQRPISTKRRISTFRAFIRKSRLTQEQAEKATMLIERFTSVSEHRKWFTHRTIENDTYRTKDKSIHLRGRDEDGTLFVREYDLDDLEKYSDECFYLMEAFWDFLTIDLGASTPKKAEKAARKIGVRLPRNLPSSKQVDKLPDS